MTEIMLEQSALKFGLIIGIIILVTYRLLSLFFRNLAFEKIKKSLNENEYILYEPKACFTIDILTPFLVGGFLGGVIVPFIIFPSIQYLDSITREMLPTLIIAEIISITTLFVLASWKYVITNTRIIDTYAFDFISKLRLKLKFGILSESLKTKEGILFNLNFVNIKSIKLTKFIDNKIEISTKNNLIEIVGFKEQEKIKSIIEQQINCY